MCDADRWLLGATTGGELLSDSAAVGEIAVGAGAVLATKLPNQDLYSSNHNIPGCSLSQCSWLLNEEYLPVTLTLLIIIKWICLSVFCQFYRFLARFSGRRRESTSSTHPPPHLHPHLEHHQHNPHVDHERHLETESNESSASTSTAPLLRLSPPRCRVLASSPSCGVVSRGSCHPSSAAHRMRSCHSYLLATLLLVASTFLGVTDACSSRSTPKPRSPSPTARPNVTFHTYKCPPAYATWYCLNGATCFTVKIGESLLYNCECADGYMGQRCEFKDLDGSYLPSRQKVMLEKASIAGGATIATILVVVVFMAIYIHRQRRRKEMRTSSVDGPSPRDVERRPFSRYPPPHFHMDSVVAHSTAPSHTSIGSVNLERASGMTAPPPMVLLPPSSVHKQEA